MKYGFMGWFIKYAFAKTAFNYIEKEIQDIDINTYKKNVIKEYKDIIKRTPSICPLKKNMFVVTMYCGAFLIALYKKYEGKLDGDKLKDLVHELAYSHLMVKAKSGKSAFTQKEIKNRTIQSKWSRDNIDKYPMNWFYYFKTVPEKEEYYITHKQCGICKLTKQEGCEEITKYLCMIDYYSFEMQGAILDRTKTLGYGDDECNFHLMSKSRAEEIGFVKNENAK